MPKGYDPNFLEDIHITLPTFDRTLGQSVRRRSSDLREGMYSDHTHFTVVVHEDTRQPIYAAANIDQDLFKKDKDQKFNSFGSKSFAKDPNYERSDLLTNTYFEDKGDQENPYDKGHMAMRSNNMWGRTLEDVHLAGRATFVYSNAALQHKNLNRDEWQELEMQIVAKFGDDANNKLSVFTGPIYGGILDTHIHISNKKSARVPSGFFKVICFKPKDTAANGALGVLTFAMFQDDRLLKGPSQRATIKTDQRYQFTISEIQKLTGIKFDQKLFDANPLYFFKESVTRDRQKISHLPERVPIGLLDDVVVQQTDSRFEVAALSERKVVINSAMIRLKKGQQSGEWVSLHNRSSGKITLKNWTLTDRMGREASVSGSILSGESMRLTGSAKGEIRLPDDGGSLMLRDEQGTMVDQVTWTGRDLRRVERGMAYMFDRGQ